MNETPNTTMLILARRAAPTALIDEGLINALRAQAAAPLAGIHRIEQSAMRGPALVEVSGDRAQARGRVAAALDRIALARQWRDNYELAVAPMLR